MKKLVVFALSWMAFVSAAQAETFINNSTQAVEILEIRSVAVQQAVESGFGTKLVLAIELELETNTCLLSKPLFSSYVSQSVVSVLATGELISNYLRLDGCHQTSLPKDFTALVPVNLKKWDSSMELKVPYMYGSVAIITIVRDDQGKIALKLSSPASDRPARL